MIDILKQFGRGFSNIWRVKKGPWGESLFGLMVASIFFAIMVDIVVLWVTWPITLLMIPLIALIFFLMWVWDMGSVDE